MRTYALTLGKRQTAAVAVLSVAAALAAGVSAVDSAASFGRLAVWCQELIFTRPSSPGAAALAGTAAALVAASAALAGAALLRESSSARALRAEIARAAVATPGRVSAALAAIGAGDLPVVVVRDGRRFAYTFGAFRPRVVVSTGLVSALSLEELKAVLRHERKHLRSRDPLRSLAWETARRAFFFLPSLRDVSDHLALARELAADRDAVKGEAGRRTLASALLKATAGGLPRPVNAWAPFGHLHGRIEALTGAGGAQLKLGAGRAVLTGAALAFILCATASPVMAKAPHGASMRCKEAVAQEDADLKIFSPFALIHPSGPSSTASDLQSKEIVP